MRKLYRAALLTGTVAGLFLVAAAPVQSQTAPDPQTTPAPATPPAMPAPETTPTPAPTPQAQAPEGSDPLVAATEAAQQWLTLTDTGRYADSWTASGKLFQANITLDNWAASMTTGRTPLGKVVSRELVGRQAVDQVPGAPAGKYAVVAFFTDFEQRAGLMESITLNREDDQWKVVGYNIQPKPEPKAETPDTSATPPANPPASETPPPGRTPVLGDR